MQPLHLLLVEDSENDAELILLALADAGLAIEASRVETDAELRDALQRTPWDLLIADFNLPSFSAADALAMLQTFAFDIPFIVVSGCIGEEAAVAILKAGAHDFVAKNNLARLAPAIERELREAETRRAHFRATQELVASRLQLRALSSHLQSVREDERTHIARELHDELGQMLTALKIDVSWLRNRWQSSEAAGVDHKLDNMKLLIDDTIAAVRRISSDLRPVMLDDLGLKAAVEWLAEEFGRRNPAIHCELAFALGEHEIADTLATAAFRIVQECLTNVCRHAEASAIQIFVGVRDDNLAITVRDNGRGLPATPAGAGHYGLLGMRERTEALGGRLDLHSVPNGGVSVEASIPLTPESRLP